MVGSTDPRWVLAVRTAEKLQGEILAPEHREQLLRLGKLQGLSPFASSLIIAIVQDQARRGYASEYCPTAGEPQLRMISPPHSDPRHRKAMHAALIVAALLAGELVALHWWLFG